ncbi:hypothetical protein [Granulosicoccus antarcticus]|uniref:hypothetical protein n=1 Tax=Granulosicoccus antarcticus TaxID=437505 RepID=UPI00197A9102|nr:hypothetical protein [Granulosicoccus antarcticus]
MSGQYVLTNKVSLVAAAVAALLAAPLAQAQPVVSGSEISWPDDGWYQVQSADGLTNICEGTRSCQVEPGSYIVINHTTGERFTHVTVPASPATGSIQVDGNTVSWPDDGWYQVQSADGLTNICEGTRSCQVEPGSYIVINHTTGERFTDVTVSSSQATDEVLVDGNTISWPDDGWYQVQSADTYESFCEGGRSCTVAAGVYIVINLTTGQRHEGIVVEGDDGAGTGLVLDTQSNELITELAGYRLDEAAAAAPEVAASIIAGNIGVTVLEAGQYEVDEIAQPTERTQYACAEGGTMTLETGRTRIRESEYSHDTSYNIWEFDNCQTELDAGVPVAGSYEIIGKLAVQRDFVSGSRFNTIENSIAFTGFDIRTDGFALTVNASVQASDNTSGVSINRQRSVSIPQYVLQESSVPFSAPSLTIADANFIQEFSNTSNGALQSSSLDVQGWISGELTDDTAVSVTTIAPLNRVLGVGSLESENVPFSGQLQMLGSDDSVLTISANPEASEGQYLFVDYNLLDADGEQRETIGAQLVDLPLAAYDSLDWLDE